MKKKWSTWELLSLKRARERGEATARLNPEWHREWLALEARHARPFLSLIWRMAAFMFVLLGLTVVVTFGIVQRYNDFWQTHVVISFIGMFAAFPLMLLIVAVLLRLLFGVSLEGGETGG